MQNVLNDLRAERDQLTNSTAALTPDQTDRLAALNSEISTLQSQLDQQPSTPDHIVDGNNMVTDHTPSGFDRVAQDRPDPDPAPDRFVDDNKTINSDRSDSVSPESQYMNDLADQKQAIQSEFSASERTDEQQAVIDHANAEQNKYEEAVQWGDDRYFAIIDDKNEVQVVPESEYQEWRNDRQQEAFQDVSNTSEIKEACQDYKIDVDELQHDMFHHLDDLKTQPGDHQVEQDACRNTILDGMDQKDMLKDISYAAEQHPNVEISIPADSQNIVADLQAQIDSIQMQQEQAIDQNRGMEMEVNFSTQAG